MAANMDGQVLARKAYVLKGNIGLDVSDNTYDITLWNVKLKGNYVFKITSIGKFLNYNKVNKVIYTYASLLGYRNYTSDDGLFEIIVNIGGNSSIAIVYLKADQAETLEIPTVSFNSNI